MEDLKEIKLLLLDLAAAMNECIHQMEDAKKYWLCKNTNQLEDMDQHQAISDGLISYEIEQQQNYDENNLQLPEDQDKTDQLNLKITDQKGGKDFTNKAMKMYQLQVAGEIESAEGYEFKNDNLSINDDDNDSGLRLTKSENRRVIDTLHGKDIQITDQKCKIDFTKKAIKMLYQLQAGGEIESVKGYEFKENYNLSTNNDDNNSNLRPRKNGNRRVIVITHGKEIKEGYYKYFKQKQNSIFNINLNSSLQLKIGNGIVKSLQLQIGSGKRDGGYEEENSLEKLEVINGIFWIFQHLEEG